MASANAPTNTAVRPLRLAEPGAPPQRSLEDDVAQRAARSGAKGILAPVGAALVTGLIFVTVYLAAFHAPVPRHLPVAVVGPTALSHALTGRIDAVLPNGFAVQRLATPGAARAAITHRRIYAAVIVAGREARLLYAGANGPGVTSQLTSLLGSAASTTGLHVTPVDARPLARQDTHGLSVFYAAFGLVLAGFLFGSLTYQIAPRLRLRQRLLSLIVFGVTGGLLITLIAKAFGALPGPFAALVSVIALMAIAVGGASMTLVRLLGGAGVGVGSVLLLVLGNSTSGGSLPADFLPAWLHPLSSILPVGVGVRALDGLAYFGNDGVLTSFAVLAAWVLASVGALAAHDAYAPAGQRHRLLHGLTARRSGIRLSDLDRPCLERTP